MGTTPEELRHEIEDTRRHLSETVDRLADRVSPGRVAHRRAEDTRRRLGGTAHRMRGAAHMPHRGTAGTARTADLTGAMEAMDTTAGPEAEAGAGGTAGGRRHSRAPLAAGVLALCTGAAAGAAVLRSRRHHTRPAGLGTVRHWRH